jgi:hypothetical protein
MLMYKEEGGFHNFHEEEVEQAKKDGWVEGEAIRNRILASKSGKHDEIKQEVVIQEEPATITAQPAKRAGRPRKFSEA